MGLSKTENAGEPAPAAMQSVSGQYRFSTERTWPNELPKPNSKGPLRQNVPLPEAVVSGVGMDAPVSIKLPLSNFFEEFRLDVDGPLPLNKASGRIASEYHEHYWVADIERKQAAHTYEGKIIYTYQANNDTLCCDTEVSITVTTKPGHPHKAFVTFLRPSGKKRTIVFEYYSPYFREVEFEFDHEGEVQPVTQIGTHDHPDHAPGLPKETLNLDLVFQRAGFQTNHTHDETSIALGPGVDKKWTRRELHDAMQNWSKLADKPQWSLWTFFASEFYEGLDWGGLMFDSNDKNQRQAAAVFYASNLFKAHQGELHPVEWTKRALFFAAVHEIGHTFNLEHSARKYIYNAWRQMSTDPTAGSFMNEPHKFSGGVNDFFKKFLYRFSNEELEFMRHAPNEFVQMGNAAWQMNHGLSRSPETESVFRFMLTTDKMSAEFEFLEPVRIQMALKNVSNQQVAIDNLVLQDTNSLTIAIRRKGHPVHEFKPYVCTYHRPAIRLLNQGDCILFAWMVSAGVDRWYIDEPGYYEIQATVQTEYGRLASNILQLKVLAPTNFGQLQLAQDYFSDEVGRVLFFNGSRVLEKANDILALVSEKLPKSLAAAHANISLAWPKSESFKVIEFDKEKRYVNVVAPDLFGSRDLFERTFHVAEKDFDRTRQSVIESLGYLDAAKHINAFAKVLLALGDKRGFLKFTNQVKSIRNFDAVNQHLEKDIQGLFRKDQ